MTGVHQGALLRPILLWSRKQVYFHSCWDLCKGSVKSEANPWVGRFETPTLSNDKEYKNILMHRSVISHFQSFPLHFNHIMLSMHLCSIPVCLTGIWLWKNALHVVVFTATDEKK